MVTIELSRMEFEHASFVGLQRCAARMYGGSAHAFGAVGAKGLFDFNIGGALAEYAVAKYLDCNWSQQPENMRIPDVGGTVEVRSTPHENGFLRLHDADKDGLPYVLALTNDLPKVTLVGWITGELGKNKRFWNDKWNNNRPAYWVPVGELHEMPDLRVRYDAWKYKKGAGAP